MIWEVEVFPALGQYDRPAAELVLAAKELGILENLSAACGHGYLVQGSQLTAGDLDRACNRLLADRVVESPRFAPLGDPVLSQPRLPGAALVYVLPKPGVTDPVASTAQLALADLGIPVEAVRTFRKYWLVTPNEDALARIRTKLLANDAIEQSTLGAPRLERLDPGLSYRFEISRVPLTSLNDEALMRLSREGQLYLSLAEMQAIQQHFVARGQEPTDAELETIAQTWSEHCSHKTLAGRVRYQGPDGERTYQNMLKETIFAATTQIRAQLGKQDWCVSVFKDNAGIVRFDEQFNLVFKVETHNHPSAIEPYGGANTGLGGVIRDPLGTGLGARPFASTDVFCFAPPDTPANRLPPGVLHPRRVMRGVVAGVRDYGNRMGIPTVNGAVCFDERYLGNPLVFCGNAGIIPREFCEKEPQPGDCIVVVGGRTGRDGIHGATFSSAELTSESEELSGGAVQIGNAITEKMLLEVVLQARDERLFHAITDCGAGGLSSAVGEMGETIGAEVWLEKVPLKYAGLTYTEIWISEAQERMVLAVPPKHWERFHALCKQEDVEATVIGQFVPTGKLQLKYAEHLVANLEMHFLHDGRPDVTRAAVYELPPRLSLRARSAPSGNVNDIRGNPAATSLVDPAAAGQTLLAILGSLNVASKEWIIRQYDHEVQAGSVIKPLVGIEQVGPSDAAVVRPVLTSRRGVVLACGINPRYGDFDPYAMAASAMDEALRNAVAVGANPARIAVLDNFCWGDCNQPATLGSLVRAAQACYDLALAWKTPFISGKDSLNNEFRFFDPQGNKQTIVIPSTLLISAMGQVDDVAHCVTMDLKRPDNPLYLVGATLAELGGSHLSLVAQLEGGDVPQVRPSEALATFNAMHSAIQAGHVRACHDLSEGGLAVAAAEMAFAGGVGATLDLSRVPCPVGATLIWWERLFSESNSRFLCEVPPDRAAAFEQLLGAVPHAVIGQTQADQRLTILDPACGAEPILSLSLNELQQAWRAPLSAG